MSESGVPDGASWMTRYRGFMRECSDIRALVVDGGPTQHSVARRRLLRVEKGISDLEGHLGAHEKAPAEFKVTAGEVRRRRELLSQLKLEAESVQSEFGSGSTTGGGKKTTMQRTTLLGNATGNGYQQAGTGAGAGGASAIGQGDDRSVSDTLQQQQKMMSQQDDDLDALSRVIERQKAVGQQISDEIGIQNTMLDETTVLMDRTNNRMKAVTKKTERVLSKSKMGSMFLCTVILIGGLVAVIVIVVKKNNGSL
eukprot:ANDGO_02871.mRNA.1 Syntaxin-61